MRRALAVLVLALAAMAPVAAQQAIELEIRAVYLYNFARFFEWPPATFPRADTPIRICVQGSDPFGAALDRAIAAEKVNGRSIVAARVSAGDSTAGCHILYLPESENRRVGSTLQSLRTRPMVTVGEDPKFLDQGGIIRFRRVENHVRFDINLTAAEAAGLRVSPRLLGVAATVKRTWP
jgi:hypothetical protein